MGHDDKVCPQHNTHENALNGSAPSAGRFVREGSTVGKSGFRHDLDSLDAPRARPWIHKPLRNAS